MSTSPNERPALAHSYRPTTALAQTVTFADSTMHVQLTDGRPVSVPLLWFPRLRRHGPDRSLRFADKPMTPRTFTKWPMALQPVSAAELVHLAGYVAPDCLRAPAANADLAAGDHLLLPLVKRLLLASPDE